MTSWGTILITLGMCMITHHIHKDNWGVCISSAGIDYSSCIKSVEDINLILCTSSTSVDVDEQLLWSGVYATHYKLFLRVLSNIAMLWLIAWAIESFLLSGYEVTRTTKKTSKRHVQGCENAYLGHEYYYEIVTACYISIRHDHSPFCVGTHINLPLSIEDVKDQLGLLDDLARGHHTAKLIVLRSFVQVVSAMGYAGRLKGYKFWLQLVLFLCVSTILSEPAVTTCHLATILSHTREKYKSYDIGILTQDIYSSFQECEPNSAGCAQRLQALIARFPICYSMISWVLYYHALSQKVDYTIGYKSPSSIDDYDESALDQSYLCCHLPLLPMETSIACLRVSIWIKGNLLVSCYLLVADEELKAVYKDATSTNNFVTMLLVFSEAQKRILRKIFSQLMQQQQGWEKIETGPSCFFSGHINSGNAVRSKSGLSGFGGSIPTLWRIAWHARPFLDQTTEFQSMEDVYQLTSLSTDLFLKGGSLVTFLWHIAWSYIFCDNLLL